VVPANSSITRPRSVAPANRTTRQICAQAGFDGGRRPNWFSLTAAILREGLMQNASAQSEAQSASSGSWLYVLERFGIGFVHIDRQLRVAPRSAVASLHFKVDQ